MARVAERVRMGGHDVPEQTIRRRYRAGLSNFFHLYQPLATAWKVLDNSGGARPALVAVGCGTTAQVITDARLWEQIQRDAAQDR